MSRYHQIMELRRALQSFGIDSQRYGAWLAIDQDVSDEECDDRLWAYEKSMDRVVSILDRILPPDPVTEHDREIANEAGEAMREARGEIA